MNKKTLLFLSILSCILTSCAVTNVPSELDDSRLVKYGSLIDKNNKIVNAGYIHVLSKKKNGLFVLQQVYPNTQTVTKQAEYTDNTLTVRVNTYKEWHWETGKLLKEGHYDFEGKPDGVWKFYSVKTGNLIREQSYYHGEFNDVEINYIDTTERMIAYKVFHPDKITSKSKPKIVYEEYPTPEGNKVFFQKKWILSQDTIKPKKFTPSSYYAPLCNSEKDSSAIFDCQIKELLRYLSKRMNIQDEINKGVREIDILFDFTINEKGEATNPVIIRTIDADTNEKIKKLVKEMPKFTPETVDGIPVSSVISIPLSIKIRPQPQY